MCVSRNRSQLYALEFSGNYHVGSPRLNWAASRIIYLVHQSKKSNALEEDGEATLTFAVRKTEPFSGSYLPDQFSGHKSSGWDAILEVSWHRYQWHDWTSRPGEVALAMVQTASAGYGKIHRRILLLTEVPVRWHGRDGGSPPSQRTWELCGVRHEQTQWCMQQWVCLPEEHLEHFL